MRLLIAAVGRARPGPEKTLFDHYAARITWPLDLREVEEKRPLSSSELREREAKLLLEVLPEGSTVVALDARGRMLESPVFAARLGRWRDDGVRDLAFVIGGANGLAPEVRERAGFVLSLGPMIWPHLLVRGLLAEQIFRAQCILAGHPYHRE